MFKLPWVSRRGFEAERDARLDAERRANQLEQVARRNAPACARPAPPRPLLVEHGASFGGVDPAPSIRSKP